ncbi:MAG: phosphoglycerate kinase [Desulfobacterales bacterium]|nr:phosphoglycerate kinase [Desulfobacterales bacterium]
MTAGGLDPRLRLMQQADMKDKVVLLRVDHNVVKKGLIKDPYRIDATLETLETILDKGGRPILMTHVGRPKDKKTGKITCNEEESVRPIARYLDQKLSVKVHVREFPADPERGILHLDKSINPAIEALKKGQTGMIYLANSRWFRGEQSEGPERDTFASELAAMADLFINDAFGSWQANVSTYDVAKKIPSFAGMLLQKEIMNTHRVLNPEGPFLAVIAGAKYDTKIGPLKAIYSKADHVILGGLMYNTFLSAKYGVDIGIPEEDKTIAMELVELDAKENRIVEMPLVVESDTIDGRTEGRYRSVKIEDFSKDKEFGYILDVDPRSFDGKRVKEIIDSAGTIFVNAVMGLMPWFFEGSMALFNSVSANRTALKLFGGGDTLQEFKNLCPEVYQSGLDASDTYYFTGGGSVLAAMENGSPYRLKPVAVLMD